MGMGTSGLAFPKPSGKLADRVTRQKARREQDRVFRARVWARDQNRCRICKRVVKRTMALDPLRGECHHLRGRRVAPEDRFNVDRAILVCLFDHLRLTRREITWPLPTKEIA